MMPNGLGVVVNVILQGNLYYWCQYIRRRCESSEDTDKEPHLVRNPETDVG